MNYVLLLSNLILIRSVQTNYRILREETATEDSTLSTLDPELIQNYIKDVGYYLRAHKFNEFDRRYEINSSTAERNNFKFFPKPPLRSLHWEVHKYCEPSFIECILYLGQKIKNVAARRNDDTAVVMTEQNWTLKNNEMQIKTVDEECRKHKKIDDTLADPFEGPLERYQWRVTASYFMCWYTLNKTKELERFDERCDNFADCLDNETGAFNDDIRAKDFNFGCALYSFCPDACCPLKRLESEEECWSSSLNPCYRDSPEGNRRCYRDMSKNTNFNDIILNRWNVTCRCPEQRGYEWNSRYGICVDVDECVSKTHNCKPKVESCLNLQGSFRCICHWGYYWSDSSKECLPTKALSVLKTKIGNKKIMHKQFSLWGMYKKLILGSRNAGTKPSVQINVYLFIYYMLILFIINKF